MTGPSLHLDANKYYRTSSEVAQSLNLTQSESHHLCGVIDKMIHDLRGSSGGLNLRYSLHKKILEEAMYTIYKRRDVKYLFRNPGLSQAEHIEVLKKIGQQYNTKQKRSKKRRKGLAKRTHSDGRRVRVRGVMVLDRKKRPFTCQLSSLALSAEALEDELDTSSSSAEWVNVSQLSLEIFRHRLRQEPNFDFDQEHEVLVYCRRIANSDDKPQEDIKVPVRDSDAFETALLYMSSSDHEWYDFAIGQCPHTRDSQATSCSHQEDSVGEEERAAFAMVELQRLKADSSN